MMGNISVVKSKSYEYNTLLKDITRSLDQLGGIKQFISRGDRVLIKPNLLSAKSPEQAVTTHPNFIKAMVSLVMSAGGIPIIGDSPAIAPWERVIKHTGVEDIFIETGVQLRLFDTSVEVRSEGNFFYKRIEVSRIIYDVDKIINLPKLKTHCQMYLTLAVKNLFGFIVGKRKPQWHMECSDNSINFAYRLLDLYQIIKPTLTIVDGIIGMDGDGPGSGDPRFLGLIISGTDCIAIDNYICDIIGGKREYLVTSKAANILGLIPNNNITYVGDKIEAGYIKDFKFPQIVSIEFGSPFLKRVLKRHVTTKPVQDKKCKLCGMCVEVCPAKCIGIGRNTLLFDYKKCIRCFCCQEICEEKAIRLKKGIILKIVHH